MSKNKHLMGQISPKTGIFQY